MNETAKNVTAYIAEMPKEFRDTLTKLRSVIKKAAPKATERISYGIPFYEYGGMGYKGRLIYFAAFKKHISVFIPPSLSAESLKKLKKYHTVKATYHFPLDKPFPFRLIGTAVRELVKKRDAKSKL